MESNGDRKSRKRLATFTKDQPMDRLNDSELENEERVHNSRDVRPGSVKGFQHDFAEGNLKASAAASAGETDRDLAVTQWARCYRCLKASRDSLLDLIS